MRWARIWTQYDHDSGEMGRVDFDADTVAEARDLTAAWLDTLPRFTLEGMSEIAVVQIGDEFTVDPDAYLAGAKLREEEERQQHTEAKERAEYERLRTKFGA